MRSCSACGHPNPNEVDTCLNCAAALGQVCSACGHAVPAGSKFCNHCGTRLPHDQNVPASAARNDEVLQSLRAMMPQVLADKIQSTSVDVLGERREVTVVFVDVKNFTAVTHNMDNEDAFLIIDEALRGLVEVIYEFEGTVDKFTGDGLMALFGAPVAHENDPERAVRAALKMQEVLEPLGQRVKEAYGFDFLARIGVNTGLVVAGQVGNDLHMEYTVIGDTVNLASRLEAAAEPGTVLVSFSTYQRTRPLIEYRALPGLMVKGVPEPIKAYQPLGLRGRPGRVRGLPGLQVPMIGRQDLLARLVSALDTVRRRRCRHIALITGEAGLGKSRLVAEFRKVVTPTDANVYQGGCLTYARTRPLWVLAEILRDILGISEIDPAEIQREALGLHVKALGLSYDIVPYLINLLGLPQAEPEAEARLSLLNAAMLQRQTHMALRQLLLAEAQHLPTVLIFEDLHWVDPASRDFLEYLIQTTSDVPLMLVLVSREAERETVIRPLITVAARDPQRWTDLQLVALFEAEAQLFIDQLIPQTTQAAQAIKRCIVERAEGIPFYIEEIVRVLIDQEGLQRSGEMWKMTPDARKLLREVPGTLKGLILARFDRLSEDLRRTLQTTSVLGRSFPVSLLESLNPVPAKTISSQLSELEALQFLVPEPFGAEPGYTFRHALIQEAVYGTLLRRDRRRIHERVAEAIERGAYWLSDEQNEVLAYHYAESANPSKAVPFLITAGEHADRRCANETAVDHYRRAIELIADTDADTSETLARAQIGLARAQKFLGEFSEARQYLVRAREHLSRLRETKSTSTKVLMVDVLRELADVQQREGRYDEAIVDLEIALETLGSRGNRDFLHLWRSLVDRMAWIRFRQGKLDAAFAVASPATLGLDPRHTDDPSTVASLYNTLGGVLWQQSNLSAAITYVERSLQLYKDLNYLWGMANSYTNLGVLYYARGNWAKAADSLEQAQALQQQIGDIQNRAVTLNNLGTLLQSMGNHAAARKDLEASLTIREDLGDTWGIAQSHVSLARLAVVQSRFDDAITHVEAALALSEALGGYEIEARWVLALAQANDDLSTGLESAEQALKMAQTAGLIEAEADCRRVLGLLRARAGDYPEAEALLRQSADLCLYRNDPYRQALVLLELGCMAQRLASAGHPDRAAWRVKALPALEEAAEKLKSLGAAYDLERAQTALDLLGAESNPDMSSSTPDGECSMYGDGDATCGAERAA